MSSVQEKWRCDVAPVCRMFEEVLGAGVAARTKERYRAFDEKVRLLQLALVHRRYIWQTHDVVTIADRRRSAVGDVGLEEAADSERGAGRGRAVYPPRRRGGCRSCLPPAQPVVERLRLRLDGGRVPRKGGERFWRSEQAWLIPARAWASGLSLAPPWRCSRSDWNARRCRCHLFPRKRVFIEVNLGREYHAWHARHIYVVSSGRCEAAPQVDADPCPGLNARV
eukprot:4939423-Pleurochrysis_carterae.AAC.3